jgi:N-acetylmuramoyl-L-alanine amidase
VTRPLALAGTPEADARALVAALLAGPTAAETAGGLRSAFPPGSVLAGARLEGRRLTLTFRFPAEFLAPLDSLSSEQLVEQLLFTLTALDYRDLQLEALTADGSARPLAAFLPEYTQPRKPAPEPLAESPGREPRAGGPAVPEPARPVGQLTGKTIYLSAGHGWLWNSTYQRWYTQRPPYQLIIEDHENAEAVNWYLSQYLTNAGANVWTVRERDFNPQELIVDNDNPGSGYSESGSWSNGAFGGYGGSYRYTTAEPNTTATATFAPAFGQAGVYAVYAWTYTAGNRVTDARFEVQHAGGMTEVVVNQELHGRTWNYLGSFYFQPGAGQRVTLVNRSTQPGEAVVADAVRFGGGRGPSGYPRYEEGSLHFAAYQGLDITNENDVIVRPHYAEWEREAGDDPVFISWHTNGFDGSARGTETYIYDAAPTAGSVELQDWVHAELIGDLRAAWDPNWLDRGQRAANLGEMRELSSMPGVLIELAFHDNPDDAAALKEPEFERIAARAIAQAIVKYYAARDGQPVHLAPEPPTQLQAVNLGGGQLRVRWQPPAAGGAGGDPAGSYRVYLSGNGLGWDNGVEVGGTEHTVTGLAPGQTVYVRVAALNAGGESLPTQVVAARVTADGPARTLLVNDFGLLNAGLLVPECTPQPWLPDCTNVRMVLDRMNRGNYLVEHARAFPAPFAFDGATRDAVIADAVELPDYVLVDWQSGLDWRYRSQGGIDAAVQGRLSSYLGAGRALLISGGDIGWDLVGNNQGPDFYRNWLRADYRLDDSDAYLVAPAPGSAFDGLAPIALDDGSHGVYNVRWPDQIVPSGGATEALSYAGGSGGTAAVQYAGSYRLIMLAFPLETVYDDGARQALLWRAIPWLLARTYVPTVQR